MANVLKKLSAFVPTMDDTVGNFESAPPRSPAKIEPVPAAIAESQAVTDPVARNHESIAATALPIPAEPDPAPASTIRRETHPTKPQRSERKRMAEQVPDTLRTKGGGIDARSLRRTGRTALMSLKLRPELPEAMKVVAYEDGISLGELMDDMWAAYVQRRQSRRNRPAEHG